MCLTFVPRLRLEKKMHLSLSSKHASQQVVQASTLIARSSLGLLSNLFWQLVKQELDGWLN
jgi:hypothetical protein